MSVQPKQQTAKSSANLKYDVLVIGSGAAGLTLALSLPQTMRVAVLSKETLNEGSTTYAQGGMAAVLAATDSIDKHVEDTLLAGAGLSHPDTTTEIVKGGPAAIDWLVELGVPFTESHSTDNNTAENADNVHDLHLTLEGGHSERRIAHAADKSGQAIEDTLIKHVNQRQNIDCFEHHIAIDLISSRRFLPRAKPDQNRCLGAYVLDIQSDTVKVVEAANTVLATGGASKTYLYTSNPDGSSGDGIAMAWRVGCRVANMEFMQFHPTCLYHPQAKSLLVSEAVRGEGGHLLRSDGTRFMADYDERMELAPRDIVARAIDSEMKRSGADSVFLDISFKSAEFIQEHFPTISASVKQFGYDMSAEPIPVVPAAHYTCGGVMVNQLGQTDLPQLYAIGETSHTGLHGANRLASNSLLECIVYGMRASESIAASHQVQSTEAIDLSIPQWDDTRVSDSDEHVVIAHNWDELRRFMWDYVGIVRTNKRLQRAQHRSDLLLSEIDEYYANFKVNSDLIELRNLATVASLIIRSALQRPESRGLHYNRDYPETETALDLIDTVLDPIRP